MPTKNISNPKKIEELFERIFSEEEAGEDFRSFLINTVLAEEFRRNFNLRIKRKGRKNVKV